jgi:hypothetical protein
VLYHRVARTGKAPRAQRPPSPHVDRYVISLRPVAGLLEAAQRKTLEAGGDVSLPEEELYLMHSTRSATASKMKRTSFQRSFAWDSTIPNPWSYALLLELCPRILARASTLPRNPVADTQMHDVSYLKPCQRQNGQNVTETFEFRIIRVVVHRDPGRIVSGPQPLVQCYSAQPQVALEPG